MNGLSWFLYAADVIPSLGNVVGIFSLISILALVTILGFWWVMYLNRELEMIPSSILYKILILSVVFFVLVALLPSKETIYLIAGSEAGEYVVVSEQGQEILNNIQEVIKYQLSGLKGE